MMNDNNKTQTIEDDEVVSHTGIEDYNIEDEFMEIHRVNPDEDPQLPIKRELYATDWRIESKEIIDIATSEEQNILLRCINQEIPTEQDLTDVGNILIKYRKAIEEQKPTETLTNVEQNIQLVQDEKQFLDLLNKAKQEDTKQLTMYYPTSDGEIMIELDIHPLTDSTAIIDVNSNLNIFKDLTVEEQEAYTAYNEGRAQTREEKLLAEHVNQKIEERLAEDAVEIMIEFLSHQTSLHGRPRNPELMREAYEKMEIGYLALLTNKVKELSGLNSSIDARRVFRTSGN